MPEMQQVESSNIGAVGYDDELEELTVEFNNGRQYTYNGVKRNVFDDFLKARSKGVFFIENVKGTYQFSRIM